MPWHLQAMKDVEGCEKLRGAAKQALIRRYLNGETRLAQKPVIRRSIHSRQEANPEN